MRTGGQRYLVEVLEGRRMLALVASTFEFAMADQVISNAAVQAEVTVLRGGDVGGESSVNYSTNAGTARTNTDFVVAVGTLSFALGETFKTVVVSLLDQPSAPATSDFTINLGARSAGSTLGTITTHTVTLQNDRAPVEIAAASYTRTTDHTTASVTVTRTGNTTIPVAVNYATEDGTALAGQHFSGASDTLTFAGGETSKIISVVLLNNRDAGASVHFGVAISGATGGALLNGRTSTSVNITNAYSPVQFSLASYATTTNDPSVSLTVTRTGNLSLAAGVDFATSDGLAVAGTDYTAASGTLAFTAGQSGKTITVPLLGNASAADGLDFEAYLSNLTGAAYPGARTSASVVISNPQASLQLDAAAYPATTDDASVNIIVNRSGNTAVAVSVGYATAGGTAVNGTDYVAVSGTLAFVAGEISKAIPVMLLGNLEAPGDRTFVLTLSSPAGSAALGAVTSSTVTVSNPYSPVRFAAAGYAASSDDANVTVTVVRSGNTSVAASVDYATGDLTALYGRDYAEAFGTLSFSPGDASETITIPLYGNRHAPDGVRFSVSFSGGSGGAVMEAPASAIVTIANPHVPIQLDAVEYDFTTDDAGATLTVARTGDTTRTVSVAYATADGLARAGTDFTARSGTLVFAAGTTSRTITVPLRGNYGGTDGAWFTVSLASPGGGAELGGTDSARVNIANPYSHIRLAAPAHAADVRDGSVLVAFERVGNLSAAATVEYATADGTAVAGADYAERSGVYTFGPGEHHQLLAIPLLGTAASAPTATFTLGLTSAGGNAVVGTPASTTVTVVNLQSAVQFAAAEYDVASDAGTVAVTLTRAGNTALGTVASVYTSLDTALPGRDFITTADNVAFAPGQTTATFSVPLLVNAGGAAEVSFGVRLLEVSGVVVGERDAARVTVRNPFALVGFDSPSLTASGDDGAAPLVVRRTGNTSLPGSVSFATESFTATPGEDFEPLTGVLSFAAGETEKAILVGLPGNAAAPAEVAFRVVISGGTGAAVVGPDNSVIVVVTNSRSLVGFASQTTSSSESAGLVALTLTRAGNLAHAVTVGYATVNGTAVAGADFTASSGTVSFEAGQTAATILVEVRPDLVFDPGETFGVTLVNPGGGAVAGASPAVVSLADSTPPPTFSGGGMVSLQRAGRLDGLALRFDQALEGAPPVAAFSLYQRAAEQPGGAARLRPVAVASVHYDPSTHAITVSPTRPLRAGVFYQLAVNPDAVRAEGGKRLDGAGSGAEGTPLVFSFAQGRKLKYVDHNGDTVQLRLQGPGVMELTRRADGEGDRLAVSGATSLTKVLGTVRPSRAGGDGATTLALVGLGAGTNLLPTDRFTLSSIS